MNTVSVQNLKIAMGEALAEARAAAAEGDFPYGAVVVALNGRIVARAQDRVVRDGDPTAHAEIGAIKTAIQKDGDNLGGYALVSNVEPCGMCSTAAWWANIECVVFGLSQQALFKMRPDSMDEPGLSVEEAQKAFSRKMRVHADFMLDEAMAVWSR